MAVKCSGCGNIISSDLQSCPICGDATDFNSASFGEMGSPPPQGLIYDMWDSIWLNKVGDSAMSRKEALLLKVLMGVLVLILAATFFFTP